MRFFQWNASVQIFIKMFAVYEHNWPYLICINAFCHRPCADNVIHHSFGQLLWHLLELDKFAHVRYHIVITENAQL